MFRADNEQWLIAAQAFGISVSAVATAFNDPDGVPTPPVNVEQTPADLAAEFAGEGTPFADGEAALKGESELFWMNPEAILTVVAASQILATEFFKDPTIRQQARDFIEAVAIVTVTPTDKGMLAIDEYHLYYVSHQSLRLQ